jgi:hypothetical protein
LFIGIDVDTDDPEKLLAMVQVVKGKHEYHPAPDLPETPAAERKVTC